MWKFCCIKTRKIVNQTPNGDLEKKESIMFSESLLSIDVFVRLIIVFYVLELVFYRHLMKGRVLGFNLAGVILLLVYGLPWTFPIIGFFCVLLAWGFSFADIFHHKRDNYTFLAINWVEFLGLLAVLVLIAINIIKTI